MYIQKTDEDCYLINLSKEEMKAFSVTYKPTGIYTEKDEEAFIKILKSYKCSLPFESITVDILPGTDESCVAIIKKKTHTEAHASVYESPSLDNFIDCAKILKRRSLKPLSSLYKGDGCYRIVTEDENEGTALLLCEFSEKLTFSKAEKLYTESYMECLIENNALEILCGK